MLIWNTKVDCCVPTDYNGRLAVGKIHRNGEGRSSTMRTPAWPNYSHETSGILLEGTKGVRRVQASGSRKQSKGKVKRARKIVSASVRRVRLGRVAKKAFRGRTKRKHQDVLRFSERTSEYSFTNRRQKPRSGLGPCLLSTIYTDGSYDYYDDSGSSIVVNRSESYSSGEESSDSRH